ncbi:MAG: tyrosine protein kinase, partial [Bacteroidaceae bacterium]|nr:tyrosine protein kinase [Bacteroidaceae bacterium]
MEDNKLRNNEGEEDVQLIPIVKQCWSIFLIYWKWFLLSVIVCLGLGWLYQQRQPRVYQRQTVMLIEDAEPSGMSGVGARKGRSNMSNLLELNG